jgi:hypothetical protein
MARRRALVTDETARVTAMARREAGGWKPRREAETRPEVQARVQAYDHSICEITLLELLSKARSKEDVASAIQDVPMTETRLNSMLSQVPYLPDHTRRVSECELPCES